MQIHQIIGLFTYERSFWSWYQILQVCIWCYTHSSARRLACHAGGTNWFYAYGILLISVITVSIFIHYCTSKAILTCFMELKYKFFTNEANFVILLLWFCSWCSHMGSLIAHRRLMSLQVHLIWISRTMW
jgi:hypothetical protein